MSKSITHFVYCIKRPSIEFVIPSIHRSLSKSAPLYMKRNTEHDPPYWRGQIWIPINYLALSSLKYYASKEGPYAVRAAELNARLRDNVVREYK